MARGVSLLPVSGLCERRWAGGADHHDVQSHGREAKVALERSLREDYGLLPYVARSRGAAAGHLCWLFEKEVPGRSSSRTDFHHSGCRCDDFFELALREVRQAAAG